MGPHLGKVPGDGARELAAEVLVDAVVEGAALARRGGSHPRAGQGAHGQSVAAYINPRGFNPFSETRLDKRFQKSVEGRF